ncbi:MAG TPA: spore coat U domain-containing protein [Burkholderiaceae bacterium]|nr:spore coat U domain-containing protein [Burkholderiaceae bacterium]
MSVTSSVAKNCAVSATPLAFGVYDPSSVTPLDRSSTISVRCTRTTPFTVTLNTGGTGGTYASRVMRDTATPTPNTLNYNLFTTAARNTVWGDGSGTTATVGGTGAAMASGNAVSLTVFGRIPVQVTAAPSSYSDSITVTINY